MPPIIIILAHKYLTEFYVDCLKPRQTVYNILVTPLNNQSHNHHQQHQHQHQHHHQHNYNNCIGVYYIAVAADHDVHGSITQFSTR